mmetsp:Transcript_80539/g.180258  ORF Transcript_80539/g.180258 Transcript_80539/m.180258 type:complete len:372 (+) Transcript_80539:44-1159(+)
MKTLKTILLQLPWSCLHCSLSLSLHLYLPLYASASAMHSELRGGDDDVLSQDCSTSVAFHRVLREAWPHLCKEGQHGEGAASICSLDVCSRNDARREGEAVWRPGVIVKAPINALIVHLFLPGCDRLLWHCFVQVAILNEHLAVLPVAVLRHVNLLGNFLISHPVARIDRRAPDARPRVEQAMEANNRLQLMASPHLLKHTLTSQAVPNGTGESWMDRWMSLCCIQIGTHQATPGFGVEEQVVHCNEGGLKVLCNARLNLIFRQPSEIVLQEAPVLKCVLRRYLVEVQRKTYVAHFGEETCLVDVKLFQPGVVGMDQHDWCRRPALTISDPAVGICVALKCNWEVLHDQALASTCSCDWAQARRGAIRLFR